MLSNASLESTSWMYYIYQVIEIENPRSSGLDDGKEADGGLMAAFPERNRF
jgi:hypothetical protein